MMGNWHRGTSLSKTRPRPTRSRPTRLRAAATPARGGREGYAERTLLLFQGLARHCLARRISSPEAERLLRRVLVHALRRQLMQGSAGHIAPPNVRIARLSGVHRNFVALILAEPACVTSPPRGAGPGRRLQRSAPR